MLFDAAAHFAGRFDGQRIGCVSTNRDCSASASHHIKIGLPFPSVLQLRKRLAAATVVEESSQLRGSRS
jgi:hypothetical protein